MGDSEGRARPDTNGCSGSRTAARHRCAMRVGRSCCTTSSSGCAFRIVGGAWGTEGLL